MNLIELGDLKFYVRYGTSDEKSIREVVGRNVYQRKNFKIDSGELWADLGGNIGAFGILAAKLGAHVIAFEPFKESYDIYKENVRLNGLENQIELFNLAVVGNGQKIAQMGVSKTGNFWRNSLIKTPAAKKEKVFVNCIKFEEAVISVDGCKMDIEGSEFEILSDLNRFKKIKKMVYEHSFDINPSLILYKKIIEGLRCIYENVLFKKLPDNFEYWQNSWFPPCANIFCFGLKV